MRRSAGFAVGAVALFAAGLLLPYAVPAAEDYRYDVEAADETFTPSG